ncbi:MAG: hypothetical protein KIT33_07165 [Candidatus Kapabacteria bacterium]|nr:hypothetical protein [Ignavibacteriota bacterium]MCW5884734.1 hypothetical protein [Candidatus Kapabacteria bacterium]
MQIEGLNYQSPEFTRPVEPVNNTEELEKQNPNIQQNIQEQVVRDATQTPTTPTAQNTQVLATVQGAATLQSTAQQQIRQGFLDIKI